MITYKLHGVLKLHRLLYRASQLVMSGKLLWTIRCICYTSAEPLALRCTLHRTAAVHGHLQHALPPAGIL